MAKKKNSKEDNDLIDENSDEEDDSESEEFKEEEFKCRVCGNLVDGTLGDDLIQLCDECAENYNVDKIWSEFDKGIIEEDELKNLDLKKYLLK